jgi:hypothetical protein
MRNVPIFAAKVSVASDLQSATATERVGRSNHTSREPIARKGRFSERHAMVGRIGGRRPRLSNVRPYKFENQNGSQSGASRYLCAGCANNRGRNAAVV